MDVSFLCGVKPKVVGVWNLSSGLIAVGTKRRILVLAKYCYGDEMMGERGV
jgi:hypothetical protein